MKKAVRIKTECLNCSKEIEATSGELSRGRKKFCYKKCWMVRLSKNMTGMNHPMWKGGKRIQAEGYIELSGLQNHPMSNKAGRLMEHRLVMSEHIGRYLDSTEDVHHINGNKSDNRIENLRLMTHKEHISIDNAQKGKKYWGINAHLNS